MLSRNSVRISRRLFSHLCAPTKMVICQNHDWKEERPVIDEELKSKAIPTNLDNVKFIPIMRHPKGLIGYRLTTDGAYPAFAFNDSSFFNKITGYNPSPFILVPDALFGAALAGFTSVLIGKSVDFIGMPSYPAYIGIMTAGGLLGAAWRYEKIGEGIKAHRASQREFAESIHAILDVPKDALSIHREFIAREFIKN